MRGYEYQSDFARTYYSQGREEGRREGLRSAVLELARVKLGQLSTEDDAAIAALATDAQLNAVLIALANAGTAEEARRALAT